METIYWTQLRAVTEDSAEGASFSSHGRKAVAQATDKLRPARAGILVIFRLNTAPSALGLLFLQGHGLTAVATK
jgi:hypothetical protein